MDNFSRDTTFASSARQKPHPCSSAASLSKNTQGQKRIFQRFCSGIISSKCENGKNVKDSEAVVVSKRESPTNVKTRDFHGMMVTSSVHPRLIEETRSIETSDRGMCPETSDRGMCPETSDRGMCPDRSLYKNYSSMMKENEKPKPFVRAPVRGRGRGMLKYCTGKVPSPCETLLEQGKNSVGEPHFRKAPDIDQSPPSEERDPVNKNEDFEEIEGVPLLVPCEDHRDEYYSVAQRQNADTAELPDLIMCQTTKSNKSQSGSEVNVTGAQNHLASISSSEKHGKHSEYITTSVQDDSEQKTDDVSNLECDQQMNSFLFMSKSKEDIKFDKMKQAPASKDTKNLGRNLERRHMNSCSPSKLHKQINSIKKGRENLMKKERKCANSSRKRAEKVFVASSLPHVKLSSPCKTKGEDPHPKLMPKDEIKVEDWDREISTKIHPSMPNSHGELSIKRGNDSKLTEVKLSEGMKSVQPSEENNSVIEKIPDCMQGVLGSTSFKDDSNKELQDSNFLKADGNNQQTNNKQPSFSVKERVTALYNTFQCEDVKNLRLASIKSKFIDSKSPRNKPATDKSVNTNPAVNNQNKEINSFKSVNHKLEHGCVNYEHIHQKTILKLNNEKVHLSSDQLKIYTDTRQRSVMDETNLANKSSLERFQTCFKEESKCEMNNKNEQSQSNMQTAERSPDKNVIFQGTERDEGSHCINRNKNSQEMQQIIDTSTNYGLSEDDFTSVSRNAEEGNLSERHNIDEIGQQRHKNNELSCLKSSHDQDRLLNKEMSLMLVKKADTEHKQHNVENIEKSFRSMEQQVKDYDTSERTSLKAEAFNSSCYKEVVGIRLASSKDNKTNSSRTDNNEQEKTSTALDSDFEVQISNPEVSVRNDLDVSYMSGDLEEQNKSIKQRISKKEKCTLAFEEDLCALKLQEISISDQTERGFADSAHQKCTDNRKSLEIPSTNQNVKDHLSDTGVSTSAMERPQVESANSSDICSKSSSEMAYSTSDLRSEQDFDIDSQSDSECFPHQQANTNSSCSSIKPTKEGSSCLYTGHSLQAAQHDLKCHGENDWPEYAEHLPPYGQGIKHVDRFRLPVQEFSERNMNMLRFLHICSRKIERYSHDWLQDGRNVHAVISVDLQFCHPQRYPYPYANVPNTTPFHFPNCSPLFPLPMHPHTAPHSRWHVPEEWSDYQSHHMGTSGAEANALYNPESHLPQPHQALTYGPEPFQFSSAYGLNPGMYSCFHQQTNLHSQNQNGSDHEKLNYFYQQSLGGAEPNGSCVKEKDTTLKTSKKKHKVSPNGCALDHMAEQKHSNNENTSTVAPNHKPRKRYQTTHEPGQKSLLMGVSSYLTPQRLANNEWKKAPEKQAMGILQLQPPPLEYQHLGSDLLGAESTRCRRKSDSGITSVTQKGSEGEGRSKNVRSPSKSSEAEMIETSRRLFKNRHKTEPMVPAEQHSNLNTRNRETDRAESFYNIKTKGSDSFGREPSIGYQLHTPVSTPSSTPFNVAMGADSSNWRDHCRPLGNADPDLSKLLDNGTTQSRNTRPVSSLKRRSDFVSEIGKSILGESTMVTNRMTRGPKSRRSDPGLSSPQFNEAEAIAKKKQWLTAFKFRAQGYQHKFIDTHCHIDFLYHRLNISHSKPFHQFKNDNQEFFPSNFEGCIAIFCNPRTFASPTPQNETLKVVAQEKQVWIALGCHPKHADEFEIRHLHGLSLALKSPNVVALGEIGLDYSSTFGKYAEIQKKVFAEQLKLALELDLPLVIHCREADDDCLDILQKLVPKGHNIHAHCFTRGFAVAQRWMDAFPNLWLGLTPLISYRSAEEAIETATHIPLNRLLLETDAPYFVPGSLKGANVPFSYPGLALCTAERVAYLKGITVDEVLKECRKNTKDMYGI